MHEGHYARDDDPVAPLRRRLLRALALADITNTSQLARRAERLLGEGRISMELPRSTVDPHLKGERVGLPGWPMVRAIVRVCRLTARPENLAAIGTEGEWLEWHIDAQEAYNAHRRGGTDEPLAAPVHLPDPPEVTAPELPAWGEQPPPPGPPLTEYATEMPIGQFEAGLAELYDDESVRRELVPLPTGDSPDPIAIEWMSGRYGRAGGSLYRRATTPSLEQPRAAWQMALLLGCDGYLRQAQAWLTLAERSEYHRALELANCADLRVGCGITAYHLANELDDRPSTRPLARILRDAAARATPWQPPAAPVPDDPPDH
ncbi:hypothetical protein LO762_09480 [Actinocorallia sp. API 0066]|uniref:hypothetical protein n=1 Tax=Actinocorallia sp. API 0066 TaxID=2896846 RepID=UPI001E2A1B09|nr:hypothetical protein [Actinocorallia sp. API 0066]MCD0449418.1 hypothetical protein [Actinocorallia sp. API 0066]